MAVRVSSQWSVTWIAAARRCAIPLITETAIVSLPSAAWLAAPADWVANLGPFTDAYEYAATARALAHLRPYALVLSGASYPPRYPPGTALLLAPAYWLPGATLANGIYAVLAFAVLAVVCTYFLAQRLAGRVAGVAAAASLLLSPLFIARAHEVMSEALTMAFAAAAALLLTRLLSCTGRRLPTGPLLVLGVVVGLATLVRLTNGVLLPAVAVGLLTDGRTRAGWRRVAALTGSGPLAAGTAQVVYNLVTFGSPIATGYVYWAPHWYASLAQTFALRYALVAPGTVGDIGAPAGTGNIVYYAHGLVGLLPPPTPVLLSTGFALLAAVGIILLARDNRGPVHGFTLCALIFTLLTGALYLPYFFQSFRFIAALLPFLAVAIGVAVGAGVRWLTVAIRPPVSGLPPEQPMLLHTAWRLSRGVGGYGICIIALVACLAAVGPAAATSYLPTRIAHGPYLPSVYPLEARVAALYEAQTPMGSLIISDVYPEMLEVVARRATVLPMTRDGYYAMPPLRAVPTLVGQQDLLNAAIRDGRPVFTDSRTLNYPPDPAAPNKGADILQSYARTPVVVEGPAVVYRLSVGPNTRTALARVAQRESTLLVRPASEAVRARSPDAVTIVYDTNADRVGQVTVAFNEGPEILYAQAVNGTGTETWLVPGVTYTFRLYADTERQMLLRTLTVRGGEV